MRSRLQSTVLAFLLLLSSQVLAVRPAARTDGLKRIESLEVNQIARLAVPVNTIPIAEQLGITDTVVVWFSFELTDENRASDLKLVYNPGPPEAAVAAQAVVDTLTFWISPYWKNTKRFYYGLPICPTCQTREAGPEYTWDSLMIELNLTEAGLPQDCIDSGTAVYPRITYQASPVYPMSAKMQGKQGKVVVQCVLDSTGMVLGAKVKETSGDPDIDLAALQAGYSCRFTAASCNGEAVACHVAFTYQFSLIPEIPPLTADMATDPDAADSVEIYPEMISMAEPSYPKSAVKAGIQGTVWVECLVDKAGKVTDVRIKKSSGTESLDNSAKKAAFDCKFRPGIQSGQPVYCWVTFKYDFKLNQ